MITMPSYLQNGDMIGVICPSGYMPLENMETCLQVLEQWGFKVKKGKTLGTHFNYFSGTNEERLADLQQMLDDENVKAILCARGGYGLSRIIDKIDFTSFPEKPKWIVGYSDITILHSHLFNNYHIASLHSPMAAAFNNGGSETEYVQSLLKALTGMHYTYRCEAYKLNRVGTATGELVGGNLCLLAHLVGSKSSIDTKGKLLFIEDIGEYIYNIDRLMIQLQRAGKLDDLAGLIVGSFADMKDTVIPFGASVYDVIYDAIKGYGYPVCFNFPVGHTQENYALKHGIAHTLEVSESDVKLTGNN
ncbi:LD-carboxypeptidase [Ilyomonas limi]|uniref:LD-carboxypeptidase n=1 Tax=Ilyomonas limi TaxID=2575867 RepID=A0A4V5UVJ8_9BACT|nr:LD-carboxypeptidase [Ilyomonas limi]TKK67803.1 LD-carboxypeptidase [Ilyomonas limi]